MACSGATIEDINLTKEVRNNEAYNEAYKKVFKSLEKGESLNEEDIQKVILAMLNVIEGNQKSVANISISYDASLIRIDDFVPPPIWNCFIRKDKERLYQLDGTKPWVIYSDIEYTKAPYGIRLYYPHSPETNPSWFAIVAINRFGDNSSKKLFNGVYTLA